MVDFMKSASPRNFAILLILLGAVSIVKIFLVADIYDFDRSATELSFGFGEKVAAIRTTGWLETCATFCASADRMPGLPFIVAGIAEISGDDLFSISMVKTLTLDAIILMLVWRLSLAARPPIWSMLGLLMVWCGPQFLLHTTAVDYEEGFTIQIIAALIAIQLIWTFEGRVGLSLLMLYLILAAAMVLTKSSMTPLFLWLLGVLAWRLSGGARIGAIALGLIPLLLWTTIISFTDGELRFGSSLDGPNLYRGANDVAAAAYPDVNLDRIFDSDETRLPDGRMIELPNLNATAPVFSNEWRYSDHYRDLAVSWIIAHPVEWGSLMARKFWVMFGAVENSPPGNDQKGLIALVGMVWMAAMRIVFWTAIFHLTWAAWRGRVPAVIAVTVFGAIAAYSAPYIIGFAYERHAVVMFLPAAFALMAACGRYSDVAVYDNSTSEWATDDTLPIETD